MGAKEWETGVTHERTRGTIALAGAFRPGQVDWRAQLHAHVGAFPESGVSERMRRTDGARYRELNSTSARKLRM